MGLMMTRKRVLTNEQVKEIRAKYMAYIRGRGYGELAKEYGVGESTIRDCVKFYTYAGV
jgi:transposase